MAERFSTGIRWLPKLNIIGGIAVCVFLTITTLNSHSSAAQGQAQPQEHQDASQPGKVFTDEDALRLLSQLRQSIENNHPNRLLKLFDAAKMPDYEEFRERISEFFERYITFQVGYHLTRVAMEGDNGVLLADFDIQATPPGNGVPSVHKHAALRIVVTWNGKEWKVVDLRPRELFSTQ